MLKAIKDLELETDGKKEKRKKSLSNQTDQIRLQISQNSSRFLLQLIQNHRVNFLKNAGMNTESCILL